MNKYAVIALNAATLVKNGILPLEAWEIESCKVFKKGSSSQKKGCPKNAFLGLHGVNTSSKNAIYATKALEIVRRYNGNISKAELWNMVMDGQKKVHNSQMDIVLALYNANLL